MNSIYLARFEEKVCLEPNTGCWLWTASCTSGGYGKFWYEGRLATAHRLAYEHHVGPIPDGLVLDHLCRVRCCVNPDHLEPVTNRENLMRGEGLSAIAAVKTHCKRGHPFSGDNLVVAKGWRRCRACMRLSVINRRRCDCGWKIGACDRCACGSHKGRRAVMCFACRGRKNRKLASFAREMGVMR